MEATLDTDYKKYLDALRLSGDVNMYGASPYLETAFGLSKTEARKVLLQWMEEFKC
jgi:hypothetical protein